MSLHPLAAHAESVPTLEILGVVYRVLLDGKQTHGAFALVEMIAPPGAELPPHVHHREEETFHMVEGELDLACGSHTVRLRAGDTFFAPRAIPHSLRAAGANPARVLVTVTPPGFERFFREADAMGARGESTPERIAALLKDQFDCELLPPPA